MIVNKFMECKGEKRMKKCFEVFGLGRAEDSVFR